MRAGSCRREVSTSPVLRLAGRPSAVAAWREDIGAVMLPEQLVQRWETVYRLYGQASKCAADSVAGDPDAARAMASASSDVAEVWREIETLPDLPWWLLAAVGAAAQAFEFQARDWNARADVDTSSPRSRPQARTGTPGRPAPRRITPRGQSGAGEHSW
jgi:hypothetical protein